MDFETRETNAKYTGEWSPYLSWLRSCHLVKLREKGISMSSVLNRAEIHGEYSRCPAVGSTEKLEKSG